MRTERLVALQSFPYAGESIKAGDTFFAEREHANILKLLGRAKDEPAPEPVATATPPQVKPEPVVTEHVAQPVVAPPWQNSTKATSKSKKTQE